MSEIITITVSPPLHCMTLQPGEDGGLCNREATVATVERQGDGSYRVYAYCRECVEALQRLYNVKSQE
jgi:hypothetical protein